MTFGLEAIGGFELYPEFRPPSTGIHAYSAVMLLSVQVHLPVFMHILLSCFVRSFGDLDFKEPKRFVEGERYDRQPS